MIDPGYCKLKTYNAKLGMDSLQVTPVAQSNANQRKGRGGGTGPGVCWRLSARAAAAEASGDSVQGVSGCALTYRYTEVY